MGGLCILWSFGISRTKLLINQFNYCMKRFILSLVLAIPIICFAQSNTYPVDSLRELQIKLNRLQRATLDSLYHTEEYQQTLDRIRELRKHSKNYTGTALFLDIIHSNFDKFNTVIKQKGFSGMTSEAFRVGFGVANKNGRSMYDIYFIIAGFAHESEKDNEKIKFTVSNAIQMDWGFDVLDAKMFSLYPYAGISLRFTSLRYDKPAQLNSSFTDITDFVINDQSVDASAIRLGYQAGLGFDVRLSKAQPLSSILFFKFGMNRPVGRDRYKIHSTTYDPHIKSGTWVLSVGFKFGGRE